MLQTLGLSWNMLSGTLPASLDALQDLTQIAVSPGNYDLCGRAPLGARFQLCRLADPQFCAPNATLSASCSRPVAPRQLQMPAPSQDGTSLQASCSPRLQACPAGGMMHPSSQCQGHCSVVQLCEEAMQQSAGSSLQAAEQLDCHLAYLLCLPRCI